MTISKRYQAILILLFITSMVTGQILVTFTAPIHEFGHYIVAKQFEWDIVEVDWFSYVEMTEETIDNASTTEKFLVSSAGMFLTLFIPYIIFIFIKKRSVIINLMFSLYLILEFCASAGDIKHLFAYVLEQLFWSSITVAKFKIGSPINLISTIASAITVGYTAYRCLGSYANYLIEVGSMIDNLPGEEEEQLDTRKVT